MSRIKLTTPVILGVITLVELIALHGLGRSACLWFAYGFYKLMQQLIKTS